MTLAQGVLSGNFRTVSCIKRCMKYQYSLLEKEDY